MERCFFSGLIGLFLCVTARPGVAADAQQPNLGGRLSQYRQEQSQQPSAHYLRMKQAQFHAWQRAVRLESQYNAGISPGRPVVYVPTLPADPNIGIYHGWTHYYARGW